MGILTDRIRQAGREFAIPSDSLPPPARTGGRRGKLPTPAPPVAEPEGQFDEREQAIIDRHTSEVQGSLFKRAARGAAKIEIDARRQQRAYAEKPPTTLAAITVDLAREMVANLGDRAKVRDIYSKMSPEQRQEALKLAPGIAQQLGDDRGGAVGRTLGAISRGVSHGVSQPLAELVGAGGTPEEIEYIRQLDAAASQEFSPARPGDPWYQRGPLQAVEMAPWMATVVGGNVAGGAIAKAGGQLLARGASAGVPGAKAVFQATGAVGKIPKLAGLKGATTKATMERAGGLAGITTAAFPQQYAQEVDQLKALGMVDDTRLRLLAGGTAAIAGLWEGIVPNPFKAGKVPLTEGAINAARQYLWNAAKNAPGELTEEYLQGVTSGLGEHVAQYIDSTVEDKSISDAFRKGWEQTKEAALPMAFLLGVPAVGGAGLSAARAQRLTRLQEIRAKGPVSRKDAKELGIEGNQDARTAVVDAEIQQLAQEAAAGGTVPPPTPPTLPPLPQGATDASQVPTNEGSNDVQGDGGEGSQVPSGSQVRQQGENQVSEKPPSQEPATQKVQVAPRKFSYQNGRVQVEVPPPYEVGGKSVQPFVVNGRTYIGADEFQANANEAYAETVKRYPDLQAPAKPAEVTPATEVAQPPVSERDQVEDEFAGLFETEETKPPAPQKTEAATAKGGDVSPIGDKLATENQSSEALADKPPTPAKLGTKGATKPARKMEPTEEGRPVDGKPVMPGDRFLTNTGRETTPFPKYSGSGNRQAINADKKSQLWLMENAIAEAESRGDDFNLTTFRSELEDARKGKLPQASKDSATLYVFGDYIPKVPKPFLKDPSKQPESPAPTGEQDTGTSRGQSGEQVGNKPTATRDELRAKFKEQSDKFDKELEDFTKSLSSQKARTANRAKKEQLETQYREGKSDIEKRRSAVLQPLMEEIRNHPESVAEQQKTAETVKAKREADAKAMESQKDETEKRDWEKVQESGGYESVRADLEDRLKKLRQRIAKTKASNQWKLPKPEFIESQIEYLDTMNKKFAEKAPAQQPKGDGPTTTASNEVRIAEIDRELTALQKQYEKKSIGTARSAMVPPAIKTDALKSITDKMGKLDAEKQRLLAEVAPEPPKASVASDKTQATAEPEVKPSEAVEAEVEPKTGVEALSKELDLELEKVINRNEEQARKGEGGQGLAVGAEYINYRWNADAIREFRTRLRNGESPQAAAEAVKKTAREWIEKHNARRPKDINWARWEGATDSAIESALRLVVQAAEKPVAAPVAFEKEPESKPFKRGDIVSAFGRDEAKVLIPDLGDLSWKKGNVRIEMTSGDNKGKTMDVEPSDIRTLAEEDTIAGKAAKESRDKAAAERAEDEKRHNAMRDELLSLVRRIKKSGVILNPKTKKAKKELINKVMMGTENRNEKMIQEAIDIVAAEVDGPIPKPYPERPHGETGDELIKRIAGREWHEVTKADFLRWAAGEYIAGGARKDRLVDDYKLGTEEQRREFHEKTVTNAIKEGKSVPPEVLADYPNLQEKVVPAAVITPTLEKQAEPPSDETIPEVTTPDKVTPVEAAFIELKGLNAPGVKQTIRVVAGERTLLMERSKHSSEWSIKEPDEYTGEVKGKTPVKTKGAILVSGIVETKKAKEIAQRIIDGTFDKEADERFVREDAQNIGLTNTGLADAMQEELMRRASFARLLREHGLVTDGRLLMKVNEKDRDAILKRIGKTDEGTDLSSVSKMMTDGQKAMSRSANAMQPIGYRGGDITTRTVVLQSQDGDATIVDKELHDTVLKKYPDAVPYFLEKGRPVFYASNGDVVAIVMPMNMDKPDSRVKELIAGKYDFEAEAAEAAKFPPPKTKLKKAAEKANKELANAIDEFGNTIKGKLGANLPLNPEVIAAAAKVVAKAIQAGTLNFAELMERMVTKYGEKMAERMREALQQAWDQQVNSNPIADEDGIPPETPQPHPELVQPEPIPLTSVKNAIVDELRVQRGEEPMPEVTPETVQQWLEAAGNRIANDPYAGNTLVEQLLTGDKTSVDETEGMVLQYHYRAVNNLFEAADAKLTEAKSTGEPEAIAIAQDEARVIMRRLSAIETALDKAGTAWGRAGVSRQIFLKQDFSLASMVRRARVANGGTELTDEQVAVISEQAKRIEELQKQLADLEAKVEARAAEQEQAKVIADAIKQDIADAKKPPSKPKSKMRLNAEARVAAAWEKFGAVAKGKLYSNPIDPELIKPALEVVKAYVDLGIVTFREFMSTAAQNMGAKEAKASEPTFRAAWDQLKEEGETTQPELDITNVGQLTRFARRVQRNLVESGITEREEVVDAVHEALQELVPEITRRQTMDALSSYGQFSQLSKDPIDQIIRDINGQLQQLAKLEDMEKGQAPAKTGVERRSPTDEERRLTQLVNEAKRRGGFVVTDPETQLKSAMAAAKTAVKNRIADMNYEIKTGSRIVRNKTELIPDAELEQLRKDRDELQKVHKEMFPPKGATQAQKIAAASRALDAAIASLEAKLAVGDISPAPQPAPLSTPELDAKRARLKALHEQRDALRKIAKPNMTAEQIKIRAMDKSIAELERQLATGNFAPKPQPAPLTSPEIDARQAKLEELRATKKAILAAANPKMTPEQRASRAYEAHLRKQLAIYLEKIAQGDFAPTPKKQPRVLTQGELDLKKKLADVKHDFFEALAKYHLENLSPGGRAIDIVRESAHLSRAIMTSIDLSAVLRQGGLGVYSHPAMARKAAGEMWKAIWSREKEFQSMEKLRTRPNAQLYEESGLNITDSEGKLTRQEEAFMGRWARTGIDFAGSKVQAASKVAFEPVAASARAYVTFINNLRADLFDVMVENLGPGGQVTKEEAKLIASYVNVATGRSDLKSLNEKAATLNTVFFAPRYVASRFQYLAMPFYLMGTKDSGRVKKLIAKEYARTFTGAAVFIGSLTALAYLAAGGDDDEMPSLEFNWLSSDLYKPKIGETRIDALAGLAQAIVFSSRMLSFHTKSSETGKIKPFYAGGPYETTHASEFYRFLRTKFAPVPGAVATAAHGMKNVVGDPVTPAGLVGGLFVPISVGEIYSTMRHRGIPKGTALAILNSMGAAVNTYGPKTAYLDATPEERAKQVNNYIKHMNWESELPAFSQYLKPEDLKRVQNRQDERRGDVVFEAMGKVLPKKEYKTEVHYEEAQERHTKAVGEFEDFRKQYAPTFTDAVRYLKHHFDNEGGIKIQGTNELKPSYVERKNRLKWYYKDLP